MNILLLNSSLGNDLGGPSIVSGFISLVYENCSDAKIVTLNNPINKDSQKCLTYYGLDNIDATCLLRKENTLQVTWYILLVKLFKYKGNRNKICSIIQQLSSFDVLVDMGGLCFTDEMPFRSLLQGLLHRKMWIIAKWLGLRVELSTTAIGPCKTNNMKIISKFYLGKYCDYICLRDRESEGIYKGLSLSTPYEVVPDTAFCMPVVSLNEEELSKFIPREKITIGLSLSFQLKKRTTAYMDVLENVCRRIQDKKYHILLIANECGQDSDADDRVVVEEMVKRLGKVNVTTISPVDLLPNQVKYVIGKCDCIIASRYHTLIAAISSGVPTLALSWHHKYAAAMALVKQNQYVVSNSTFSADIIIGLLDRLCECRAIQSKVIEENTRTVQMDVAKMIKRFVGRNKNVMATIQRS